MARLPQTGDDLATRLRDTERRLAELEARPGRGLIVPPQILTADSSGFTDPATSDFARADVPVDATRAYRIHLLAAWQITGANDRAIITCHADGTPIGRMGDTSTVGPGTTGVVGPPLLWLPATGTPDLDIRLTELGGGGTFTFNATSTVPRQFWVEDIGPRPT